jgi:hypothetical protein
LEKCRRIWRRREISYVRVIEKARILGMEAGEVGRGREFSLDV